MSQYLQLLYTRYPKLNAALLITAGVLAISMVVLLAIGGMLHAFDVSLWWLLLAGPVALLVTWYSLLMLVYKGLHRYRKGFKNPNGWQELLTPMTRIAMSPSTGLDREEIQRVLQVGLNINDADAEGCTLLDHMLLPMYRSVFKAEDVEYLLSIGAREPEDFIAKLRAIDHDDAYLLADKLQAQARQPELKAIAIANRGAREEGEDPRRRM